MSGLQAEMAWPGGDCPGELDFRFEPSPGVARALSRALAPHFPPAAAPEACYQALRPPDGPAARYRLRTDHGTWFVRVSTRWGHPELEEAVVDYLFAEGLDVNPFLAAGVKFGWNSQVFRVDVRPLIQGRPFDRSAADLWVLASSLGACHRALADFPRAREIRAAARRRSRRLAGRLGLVAEALRKDSFALFGEQAAWAARHRGWLAEMVEKAEPCLGEYPRAQCLHGEVHPANVLFDLQDGAAILVDFEESVHLYAPPAWDLAYLVQRFCLADEPTPFVRGERLEVVERAYGRPLPPLAGMMRQAAWFSLAVLLDLRLSEGLQTPLSEYDKFVRLERQARALEGVL